MFKQSSRPPASGFTLIELMIVIALVGIITLIAIPSYQDQILRTNRAEAKTALISGAQALERCYTTFSSYSGSTCPSTGDLDAMGEGFFTYTMTKSVSSYSITATATGNQAKDTTCTKFRITSLGAKTSVNNTSTNTSSTCW